VHTKKIKNIETNCQEVVYRRLETTETILKPSPFNVVVVAYKRFHLQGF